MTPLPSMLAELIEARTGLAVDGAHARRAEAAVGAVLRARRCRDPLGLASLAAQDRHTMADLVGRLVVHESYFFRDPRQLALVTERIAKLAHRRPGDVDVWSAGCAQGEEAASVVMLADERGLRDRVRVLGTDLVPAAIAKAVAGRHGPRALRTTTPLQLQRWFQAVDGDEVLLAAAVRARTRFAVHNLLDPPPGRFDVVLCRNVLMYLTPAARARASARLAEALRPGGWLVTGASDPPLESSVLAPHRTPLGAVYVAAGEASSAEPDPRSGRGVATLGAPVTARSRSDPGAAPSPPRPSAPSRRRPASAARSGPPKADALRELLDRGAADAARNALAAALATEPLDPELRRLAAIACIDADDPAGAVAHARAGVYLDPASPESHRLLGWSLDRLGRTHEARRSFERAARLEHRSRGLR